MKPAPPGVPGWARFFFDRGLDRPMEFCDLDARFGDQIREYYELFEGIDGAGIQVHGEGRGFTRQVLSMLQRWDMRDDAREHFAVLAQSFAHRRMSLRVAWSHGRKVPSLTFGFRRRPGLDD